MQKHHEKTKKRQKRTQFMCGPMLRWIRLEMGFDPRDMRETLGLPRRTYQDYEAGKRGLPTELAARIREMFQRDRELMAGIAGRVDVAWERGER